MSRWGWSILCYRIFGAKLQCQRLPQGSCIRQNAHRQHQVQHLNWCLTACCVPADPLRMNPNQATNVSSQQAPALQTTELVAAVTAAVPSEQSSSSAGADWDKSDDWEPDLTALRKAANLPRETAAVAATANGQVEPQAGGPQGSGGSWRSGSNAATRTSSSSGRPASAGGRPHSSSGRTPETTPPRPRGRGESRLDAASDSDTEWDSISGETLQQQLSAARPQDSIFRNVPGVCGAAIYATPFR